MKKILIPLSVLLFVAGSLFFPAPKIAQVYAQTSFTSCDVNQTKTTTTLVGATTGTAATQIVPLVAATSIYVCRVTVVGISGTTPTFSLVYGTGANCATGQTVFLGAVSTVAQTVTTVGGPYLGAVPAGKALCYLDAGTTPVQNYIIVYAQG